MLLLLFVILNPPMLPRSSWEQLIFNKNVQPMQVICELKQYNKSYYAIIHIINYLCMAPRRKEKKKPGSEKTCKSND